jgi:hypothetical protein
MQMQLPFFPTSTKLFNPTLGCFESGGMVQFKYPGSTIIKQIDMDDVKMREVR